MNAQTILENLRKNIESTCTDNGATWGMVYLDNARTEGTSKHSFAGFLSSLEAQGLYRKTADVYFGEVLLQK